MYLSPELQVFFGSMLPITELRGAIPYGIFVLKMDPLVVFLLAVAGNFIPNIFILWLLPRITQPLRTHWSWFDYFLKKTHDHHTESFKRWGEIFIIFFVGVPLPGSGSWSGSLLAYLFDISYWKALGCILLGIIIAGLVVLGISTGAFKVGQELFFLYVTQT